MNERQPSETSRAFVAHIRHHDLCRISRVFNQHCDLRDDNDRRANELLQALISSAKDEL